MGVCHGVEPDAGEVGAPCAEHAACAGAARCIDSLPGGYCTELDCTSDSCPAGSSCVKLDGRPTCLRDCAVDDDCAGTPEAERRCAQLKDLDKEQVLVCVSGAEGHPVGSPCGTGVECFSGFCDVLGEGRCTQTGSPCDTEADCSGAEFCQVVPGSRVGMCSAECSVAQACPGNSFCVGQPGAAAGVCRPPCNGPTDVASCRADDGLACRFGYALGSTSGQGQYLCAVTRAGGLGEPCEDGFDCDSATCAPAVAAEGGLCVAPCDGDQYCPFPGTCVVAPGDAPTCRRTCLSLLDCPSGMQCAAMSGSVRMVCQ